LLNQLIVPPHSNGRARIYTLCISESLRAASRL
jgi:hypothetical protein